MADFEIAGHEIPPGVRSEIMIDIGRLPDFTEVDMRVKVIRGVEDGPTVFVTACIHGDEVNGLEVVRKLGRALNPQELAGTVILVPIVNVFGFIQKSRYLPDRRDLNRSFPGSTRGSMASQLANKVIEHVVCKSDAGIDLHTGPEGRFNLPQAWVNYEWPEARELAQAFGMPYTLKDSPRDGSLRKAAQGLGVPVVLFEGGEGLRFEKPAIQQAFEGVLRVLGAKGMIETMPEKETVWVEKTRWVRARRAGVLRPKVRSGDQVEESMSLGSVGDPFGSKLFKISAPKSGVVLSHATSPLVNKGDAIFRIGTL